MKLKMIATIVGALVAANAYAAETYNIEAGGEYNTSSTDSKTDQTIIGVGGTYYFKPIAIDTTKPFAELDVLQRASSVTVRYADVSIETATFAKTTVNPMTVKGTLYVDDFIFGLNNETWSKKFNLKANAAYNYDIKSTTTGFNVGYFVTPTTSVSFVNEKNDATYTRSSTQLTALKDLKVSSNGLTSRSILPLSGTQSIVIDLAYTQIKQEQTATENNKEISGKVRYYPEAKYFVEGGYISNTGDNAYDKGKTMIIGAGYAITPRLGVALTTAKFSGDVSAENSSGTQTSLIAGYRF